MAAMYRAQLKVDRIETHTIHKVMPTGVQKWIPCRRSGPRKEENQAIKKTWEKTGELVDLF